MVKSDKPFDYSSQKWIGIGDKFPKKIHNATTTSDGLMSAEDKAKLDAIDVNDYNRVYDIATWETDGLMSKEDKKKMDGIEENANNYIHPNTPEIRHVTDQQIEYWNAKASTAIATETSNGLMSKEDKKKLNNIEEYANHYIHPDTPEIRHVTDKQIEYWNNKASTEPSNPDSDGLMSAEDKKKLDSIEWYANNYIHPDNEGIRHVSDAEKDYWNSKASKNIVTNSENGLMSYIDKIKLDGIEAGANNYVHPDNENTRHVSDAEKEIWNNKASTDIATEEKPGLISAADKKKLDSIEENANYYIHPDTPDIRHVTDSEKDAWNAKAEKTVVTEDNNGLMSSSDKVKLNTIDYNANNYIHPETHPATMIVEDKNHRFVTDAEKEKWGRINDIDLVTPESDGLMSKEDKQKLDELIVPETYELSLVYSEWTNIAPYTQVLNVPGIEPGINAYIGINANATIDEMTCAAEAKLKVGKVEKDKILIIATGKKPDMNLPVIIMAGSSILIFEVKQFNGREEYAYEPPTLGFHHQNEIVYSFKPVQTGCIGWVCIETGEPGKWQPFGEFELPKT